MKGRFILLPAACFILVAACARQNEPKVEALESQLEDAQSRLAEAQTQERASRALNARTGAELARLRNVVRDQSARIDEQADAIESQQSRIDELNLDNSLLMISIGQNPDGAVDTAIVGDTNSQAQQ